MNDRNLDIATVLLRITMGMMFISHGLLKLMVFTLSGTAQFFAQVGFPSWMAYPVTFFEIIAGALLILGFYSRYIAIAAIPVLLGATLVHWGNGWVFSAKNGGWEYPVFLTLVSIVIALLGDGRYALSRMVFRKHQTV